ncbi:MAG: hypothetical protein HFE90_06080 [Firmicutes bacterium]|nr:hypothetical protein [Bacillota bacterium]
MGSSPINRTIKYKRFSQKGKPFVVYRQNERTNIMDYEIIELATTLSLSLKAI